MLPRPLALPWHNIGAVSGYGLVRLELLVIQVTQFLLGLMPRVFARDRGRGLVQWMVGWVHQLSRRIRDRVVTTNVASG